MWLNCIVILCFLHGCGDKLLAVNDRIKTNLNSYEPFPWKQASSTQLKHWVCRYRKFSVSTLQLVPYCKHLNAVYFCKCHCIKLCRKHLWQLHCINKLHNKNRLKADQNKYIWYPTHLNIFTLILILTFWIGLGHPKSDHFNFLKEQCVAFVRLHLVIYLKRSF